MDRRQAIKVGMTTTLGAILATTLANCAGPDTQTDSDGETTMDQASQATFDTVMAFMTAMGSGDMDTMSELMADDMV